MKKGLVLVALLSGVLPGSVSAAGDASPDWFRDVTISADGATVYFTAGGDIYRVSSDGGPAEALSLSAAWEGHPVISHDGRYLAFASDRFGNPDIFLADLQKGTTKRLTFHSAADTPSDFSPDGKYVLFQSRRQDDAASSINPRNRQTELYAVSISGGTPRMILTTAASEARYSPDGRQILYRGERGYESPLRKHDVSSFTRDIWLYDLKSGHHRRITTARGGDHTPVWAADGKAAWFLSERGGSFNVWRSDLAGKVTQVTRHSGFPVRSLGASKAGKLAYSLHGDIHVLAPGGTPRRLDVRLPSHDRGADLLRIPLAGKAGEFALSPNGKEVAFTVRGDVFVTALEFDTTRQITRTAGQERQLAFTADGRGLLYAAERDGRWQVFETRIGDKTEKYFFTATRLGESRLFDSPDNAFMPKPSPDGNKVAFVAGRDAIAVFDRKSGKVTTALGAKYNYSYQDDDMSYSWSPDSRWLAATFAPHGRLFFTNIAIVPADGGKPPVDISLSGYTDMMPRWHKDGGMITWRTARFGRRDHGSHGSDFDVEAVFLTQQAWDRFRLTREEWTLREEDRKEAERKAADGKGKGGKEKKKSIGPVTIAWDGMLERQARLTRHASDLAGHALSADGSTLYYLSRFEKGYELWRQNLREKTSRRLAGIPGRRASMALGADGKTIVILADGKLSQISVGDKGGKAGPPPAPKPIAVAGEADIHTTAERLYMFDHIWRQIGDKFYKPGDMHGVDWPALAAQYRAKVAELGNNRDFATLISEMVGELNVSHTGARYRPRKPGDETAALGAIYDMKRAGPGMRIAALLPESPLLKAARPAAAGMIITAIDGVTIGTGDNFFRRLNGKAGKRLRLTLGRPGGKPFDMVVRPVSLPDEDRWLYKRWVRARRAEVARLSKGRLGYIHIPQMNDAAYRDTYRELFGRAYTTEAVVIDTRFNGGGDLTDDLNRLLTGRQYMTNMPRGRVAQGEPLTRWTKPSIVIMNEGNYSDGHCFPAGYKRLGAGRLVGMPVPGTCTYNWREMQISGDVSFSLPQIGIKDPDGDWMELKELEPDIKVNNTPEDLATGRDPQLAAAVTALLEQLDGK